MGLSDKGEPESGHQYSQSQHGNKSSRKEEKPPGKNSRELGEMCGQKLRGDSPDLAVGRRGGKRNDSETQTGCSAFSINSRNS